MKGFFFIKAISNCLLNRVRWASIIKSPSSAVITKKIYSPVGGRFFFAVAKDKSPINGRRGKWRVKIILKKIKVQILNFVWHVSLFYDTDEMKSETQSKGLMKSLGKLK